MPKPEHLGDGVYISPDKFQGGFIMTANHHDPELATDKIFLDPSVITALVRYLKFNGIIPE